MMEIKDALKLTYLDLVSSIDDATLSKLVQFGYVRSVTDPRWPSRNYNIITDIGIQKLTQELGTDEFIKLETLSQGIKYLKRPITNSVIKTSQVSDYVSRQTSSDSMLSGISLGVILGASL